MIKISLQYFGGRGGGGSGGARGGGRAGGGSSEKSSEVTVNGVSLDLGDSAGYNLTWPDNWRAESAFKAGDLSIAADSKKEAIQQFNKALNNPDGGGMKMVPDKNGFTCTVYESFKGRINKNAKYPDILVERDPKTKKYTIKQV